MYIFEERIFRKFVINWYCLWKKYNLKNNNKDWNIEIIDIIYYIFDKSSSIASKFKLLKWILNDLEEENIAWIWIKEESTKIIFNSSQFVKRRSIFDD